MSGLRCLREHVAYGPASWPLLGMDHGATKGRLPGSMCPAGSQSGEGSLRSWAILIIHQAIISRGRRRLRSVTVSDSSGLWVISSRAKIVAEGYAENSNWTLDRSTDP